MLHATVFKDFISIRVSSQVYKMARQMVPRYAKNGMDGHDMQDFLENVLSGSTLSSVDMDPESGEFFCYIKLGEPRKVTKNDVHKTRMWLSTAQDDITRAYMEYISESLSKSKPEMEFTNEAEDLKDFVLIRGLGNAIE